MDKNLLELSKNLDIGTKKDILSEIVSDIQNNYLKSEFGKVVNAGLDAGIRAIFPENIGEQIINVKDNIYNYGLKDGLDKSIEETINLGKTSIGLFTNNFENISQVESAIEKGGTIDKISDLVETGIEKSQNNNKIDNTTAKILKNEKSKILNNIEQNLEKSLTNQKKNIEKLEKYISNWKEGFKNQDFGTMKKEYNKMLKIKDSLMVNEDILNNFKMIENIQTLLKNNGNNFNITQEEIELANKLVN